MISGGTAPFAAIGYASARSLKVYQNMHEMNAEDGQKALFVCISVFNVEHQRETFFNTQNSTTAKVSSVIVTGPHIINGESIMIILLLVVSQLFLLDDFFVKMKRDYSNHKATEPIKCFIPLSSQQT